MSDLRQVQERPVLQSRAPGGALCGKTHEEIAAATAAPPSAQDPPSVVIPMKTFGQSKGLHLQVFKMVYCCVFIAFFFSLCFQD